MTFLILLAGIATAIATVVGYVNWRDRHRRGSFVDPSVSRHAIVQANRQAVQGRLAAADMPVTNLLSPRAGSR